MYMCSRRDVITVECLDGIPSKHSTVITSRREHIYITTS